MYLCFGLLVSCSCSDGFITLLLFSSIHDHVDDVWDVHFGITIGVSRASEVHVKETITSSEQFFLRFGFMGKWSSCERDITSSERFFFKIYSAIPDGWYFISLFCHAYHVKTDMRKTYIFSEKAPWSHLLKTEEGERTAALEGLKRSCHVHWCLSVFVVTINHVYRKCKSSLSTVCVRLSAFEMCVNETGYWAWLPPPPHPLSLVLLFLLDDLSLFCFICFIF